MINKQKLIQIFLVCMVQAAAIDFLKAERVFIGGIAAVIYLQSDKDGEILTKRKVVTVEETQRPGIDGRVRSLEELVFEILLNHEAEKYHITLSDAEVERILNEIMKNNNIEKKDLIKIFNSSGYTWEEGVEAFVCMYTAGRVLEFRITREALIVPKKEVVFYYEKNPKHSKPYLVIQRGFIPYDYRQVRSEQEKKCAQEISQGDYTCINWASSVSIEKEDISPEKQFILSLPINTPSNIFPVTDGFEVYKVLENCPEKLISLDERYSEIVEILRRPKLLEKQAEYKQKLYEKASIVYF